MQARTGGRALFRMLACSAFVAAMSCVGVGQAADFWPSTAPPYELDEVSRSLEPDEAPPCERGEVELVTYRGTQLRYHKAVRVHPAFREQLVLFEAVVDEVAREHFGRAPRRIVHLGSYVCRSMRRHPHWLSEHALGNAIDVAGFDFGPLPRAQHKTATSVPKGLRRPFEVRVDRHWEAEGKNAPHAAFLRALAERLIDRPEIFHVILGPDWPGHHNHFHFDHAPYRMVKIGEHRSVFWRW